MQLESGYVPRPINRQRSTRWARLLFAAYLCNLLFEWSMVRFSAGPNGRWVATTATEPEWWLSLLFIGNSLFSLVVMVGFVVSVFREKADGIGEGFRQMVTSDDLFHMFAWLQLLSTLQLLLYIFVMPYPLFPEGTVGGMLESASLQLFILFVSVFLLRGKWQALGFRRPNDWGRLLAAIFAMFAFIALALDVLITNPLADWLHLSLASEREEGIQQEIVQAKAHHLLTGLFAVATIGIIAPFGEEILFRGVVQTYLVKRWGPFWGIFTSSFWFALIHVDVALFVPLFAIGLALGYLRHRFQTIWGSIVLHSVNNTVSVLYDYL